MTENLNDKIIIYQSEDGKTQLDVTLEHETVWLTQKQIAELFGTKRPAITKHLKNIYASEELTEESTCSILEHMGNDGRQSYNTKYYNLDAILSVGYRVNSKNATRFRQWANSVLKQYLVKGYAINENIRKQQIAELRQLIQVLGRAIQQQPAKTTDESNALFDVVVDYTYTLDTLDKYDILLKSFIYQIYPTPLTHHNRPHSYPYRLTFYMKSFTLYKEQTNELLRYFSSIK